MRITCDVETSNRLCATLNMRGKGKMVRAQLSVGRKPGADTKEGEIFLMMCTKQDKNGTKYKLRKNVEQIFGKFISEGKVTIRFTQPPVDLCICKADPIQLKGFMSVVKLGIQGDSAEKVSLSLLSPATSKTVERLKKRLSITDRKDYPITTGFPSGLDTLHVQHCNMKRLDSRILQLQYLRVLNLSHNRLTALPEDWSRVPSLGELHLAENQITDIPKAFCTNMRSNLSLLDLSKNKIKMLNPTFCQLHALVTLRLNENELVVLPAQIGHMSALRFLHLTHNQLRVLPATFGQLRLEELDLFDNKFLEDGPSTTINKLNNEGGLLELCARAVKKYKLHYTREDLPGFLYDMLGAAKLCPCGSMCFRSFVHYLARLDLHKVSSSVVAIDALGRTHAPSEAFLCSQHCYDRYKKNPHATIWRK